MENYLTSIHIHGELLQSKIFLNMLLLHYCLKQWLTHSYFVSLYHWFNTATVRYLCRMTSCSWRQSVSTSRFATRRRTRYRRLRGLQQTETRVWRHRFTPIIRENAISTKHVQCTKMSSLMSNVLFVWNCSMRRSKRHLFLLQKWSAKRVSRGCTMMHQQV